MKNHLQNTMFTIIFLLLPFFLFGEAQSQRDIRGRVIDADNGQHISVVEVRLTGTRHATTTDAQGSFRFHNVAEGVYSIVFSHLGYETQTMEFVHSIAKKDILLVTMNPLSYALEAVTVVGVLKGQASALSRQKQAESIRNIVSQEQMERFPDYSVAESIRRIPGISTDYRRGEASDIMLRGLPSSFHTVTIDGQRLASTDATSRISDVSIINTDMIATLEVIKSITADMDADATSGSVNLISKKPVGDEPLFHVNIAGGYNNLSQKPLAWGGITYGRRSGNLDWVVSGSQQRDQRDVEDIRHDWSVMEFDGVEQDILARLTSSAYETERIRSAVLARLDYHINERSSLYLTGHLNHFNDYEKRSEVIYRLDDGDYETASKVKKARYERDYREQERITQLYSLRTGGRHDVNLFTMDYHLGLNYGRYEIPLRESIVFRHNKRPDYLIDISDRSFGKLELISDDFNPTDFQSFDFRQYDRRLDDATDRDYFAAMNIGMPYNIGQYNAELIFGGKYRVQDKKRETLERRWGKYDGDKEFGLHMFAFDNDRMIVDGRYPMHGGIDWDKAKGFFDGNINDFKLDENRMRQNSDPYTYEASENLGAAYILSKVSFDNIHLNLGVRMETTSSAYTGNVVTFDESGDYSQTQEVRQDNITHTHFFPMLHLRYAPGEQTRIRASYTQTIIRPDFISLVPYSIIDNDRERISRGNPDLIPSTSQNIDLIYERYLPQSGLLSAGLFYKDMKDFIYIESTRIEGGDFDKYRQERPENGESAYIYGFEITWQQRLHFLPGLLEHFSIYANYTYSYSEAKIMEPEERRIGLPMHSPHLLNLALSYDIKGFSAQLAYRYRDTSLHSVGVQDRAPAISQVDDVFLDRFFRASNRLDMTLSYHINPRFSVYANLNNLLGGTHEQYFYDPVYPFRNSYFSWWGVTGIRFQM